MKKPGTDTLVLDVRGNHRGNSLIVDILVYFSYGTKTLDIQLTCDRLAARGFNGPGRTDWKGVKV